MDARPRQGQTSAGAVAEALREGPYGKSMGERHRELQTPEGIFAYPDGRRATIESRPKQVLQVLGVEVSS